ncbi:hypothetical protein [Denitromonas iodatirespirans]|uniref:Tetratricopeptide repeat protein n=1 Tax=Denitromonas iodatirespirans TaxID=2795389 RepID=A0A944H7P3_DENI1|nr:hypothetical protein [Denitromonas iodatirespirans]MBT0960505.1 hypothetical protein [Denitromonas iodatirespirans]
MDLLDFTDCTLYFEDPLPARAEALLNQAAREYGQDSAEIALLRAHLEVPENLTVLVGLYRYYFYQHRLDDALLVAERAMNVSGRQLGLPTDWRAFDDAHFGTAAQRSFGLLRFYLFALKAASVVLLRLRRVDESRARLAKLASFESRDQLGVARLLEVIDEFQNPSAPAEHEPAKIAA